MKPTLIGYARCSTDKQDLSAQRQALLKLGVSENIIYTELTIPPPTQSGPYVARA